MVFGTWKLNVIFSKRCDSHPRDHIVKNVNFKGQLMPYGKREVRPDFDFYPL